MKKIFILFLTLALAWIVKLSYDLYLLNSAQTELNGRLNQIQQQNANLNDQLVALKRLVVSNSSTAAVASGSENSQTVAVDTHQNLELVEQYLDLIEFALQQQQHAVAVEKLNRLKNEVAQLGLAPALAGSLEQAIVKDQETLKQWTNERVMQRNRLNELLSQIDAEIKKEIQLPHQASSTQTRSFWQRWIQIEPVEQMSSVLMQRHLILKEAQLRLLIAQNTLQQGQQVAFQQALQSVIDVLEQLPDERSQHWIKQLQQIKATPLTPVPLLNTRTLLS
ncbi:hypothetical protein OC498_11910 [Acinetobacter bohemicus]|uniref:hypothetical protein n=1 Tax=Acinetobacter TaxID=469 RepID=UPI001194E771|nr:MULTISPECIES: hypothetical protein [Acinetobacter]MCO8043306.1 hypothetical protein [Acinetobacter sp. S4400-12]MCU7225593.1 hypothetical protein [Acinetobacter bohemicus]TSH71267.1 hypothetical protein E2K73_11645 [Acinetobacter sp. RF15A]TSI16319.1 hypothetical protein E2K74_11145 [Acinetobacter sp. RF15B]